MSAVTPPQIVRDLAAATDEQLRRPAPGRARRGALRTPRWARRAR